MDIDEIINNEYKIIKKIGSGSFGNVYKGISILNNNFVAIKIEKTDNNKNGHQTLFVFPLFQWEKLSQIFHEFFLKNKRKFHIRFETWLVLFL